ncbi:disintegrin and metalloproteinase domain-containing protein 10-like [Bufo bufo]|uniref:disintegrin and metalloproteinase domain-containing protein 10-like n=1 Tax=Bufo bufo TaxID=8384 RepID=UPI001ABE165A|nr:disintegrin and metalloproteinase domain-containing protein 10-like [Bufo bufo]
MLLVHFAVQFLIPTSLFVIGYNGNKVRPFLKYYETASYNRDDIFKDHLRSKRATNQEQNPMQLEISGYNRKFEMMLGRDRSVFTDDFKVISDDTSIPMDISFLYSGKLKDEEDSLCHGSVIDGYFHGSIQTRNGTFYIEYEQLNNGSVDPYMYHERDIDYSLMKDVKSFDLALKKYEFFEKFKWKAKEESFIRTKRSVDPSRTTCLIYLKADYFFFKRFRNLQEAISQIAGYMRSVNAIYEKVNFNGIRHINFKVKVLNIIQEEQPNNAMHGAYIGPEKLLMLHSSSNWNNVCLSYLLTNRDYNGILGLAWTGKEGNNGGICSKFSKFKDASDTEQSLNTGIVTIQKYGQYLPPRLIHITLAHEFGHSLGSPHDKSNECANFTVSSPNGNYLMFPYAMDGNQYNNDKFSNCSIHYIASLLKVKKDRCFVESGRPICGNQIVEDGEQCDVGLKDNDMCCYGVNAGEGLQCTLRPGKQCSPSQGQCCNNSCLYKPKGGLCREEAECTFKSFCLGESSICPTSTPKSNYTLCNAGTRICLNGMCRQSVCAKYGLEQCDCDTQSLYNKCQLCCQKPGDVYSCRSTKSSELGHLFNMTAISLPPGAPCEQRQGYCDKFHVCRLVDADGPIARLKNSFLNLIEFDPAAWMKTRWWAVLLIILTMGAVMAGTILIFGRTLDSNKAKNTTKESKKTDRTNLRRSNTDYHRRPICNQREEVYMASIYVQSETRI